MNDPKPPAVGDLARDKETGKIGVIMAVLAGRYYLRAKGGGKEWDVDPAQVEPYKLSDQLADRIREERRGRYPR